MCDPGWKLRLITQELAHAIFVLPTVRVGILMAQGYVILINAISTTLIIGSRLATVVLIIVRGVIVMDEVPVIKQVAILDMATIMSRGHEKTLPGLSVSLVKWKIVSVVDLRIAVLTAWMDIMKESTAIVFLVHRIVLTVMVLLAWLAWLVTRLMGPNVNPHSRK